MVELGDFYLVEYPAPGLEIGPQYLLLAVTLVGYLLPAQPPMEQPPLLEPLLGRFPLESLGSIQAT